MMALGSHNWQKKLNMLLEDFQHQCRRFLPCRTPGGRFVTLNRQGLRKEYSLLSLSVGVVHLHTQACNTLDASQLAELASKAKRCAKDVSTSVHVIDAAAATFSTQVTR